MGTQSYKNHTRWDPWYHFVLSPLALLNVLYQGMKLVKQPGADGLWGFVMAVAFVIAVMKLRLNPLKVQDRLIRLEEQGRFARLGGVAAVGEQVSIEQWIALRFASDAELVALAGRAVAEQLTADQIKEAIRQWRPDEYRV